MLNVAVVVLSQCQEVAGIVLSVAVALLSQCQELTWIVLTVAVALLSQCHQGGLMEEQGGGVVYDGSGEGEVGAEGSPVICSTELPLVTSQVLTVSTPEDEEPKVCCCYDVCGTA